MESINSVTQGESGSGSGSADQTSTVDSDSAGAAEPNKQKTDELRQLKEDLRQLKEDIQTLNNFVHALKTENQLLKSQLKAADCATLADDDLHKNVQGPNNEVGLTLTSCLDVDNDNCQVFAPSLPPEILSKIFEIITDTSSLLACRAVCTSWKSLIDNSPALMRRFTFIVAEPSVFLSLTNIVARVSSIKLVTALPSDEDGLRNLVRDIAPTLESVAFDWSLARVAAPTLEAYYHNLMDNDLHQLAAERQQHRIVSLVLRQCSKLNELRILSKQMNFIHFARTEQVFNNITSLTVRGLHLQSPLIESLPRLSNLTLHSPMYGSGNFESMTTASGHKISNAVCRHILKYPGVLKKFGYNAGDHRWLRELDHSWTKMFLLAGQHDVVVTIDRPFNLQKLSTFAEYPVNLKTCSAINNVLLACYPDANFDRAELCLNVEQIEVTNPSRELINQPTLDILCRLNKLRKLSLNGFSVLSEPLTDFLTTLHAYFPNLMDLRLSQTSVPENIFVSLSRLGRLTRLELKSLLGLTDEMVLHQSNNSPAIAILPKLKELTLWDCRDVTNNCLTNGILLNPTLETLTLLGNCEGFTDYGHDLITNGRLTKMRIIRQGEDVGLRFTLR